MNNVILELFKIDLEPQPFCFVLTTPPFFFFFLSLSLSLSLIFVRLLFNVKLHVPIVLFLVSANQTVFVFLLYMTTLENSSTIILPFHVKYAP